MGRSICRIKMNEPAPKTSASTPPSGPWRKIPIQHSKRYARHENISFLTIFLFVSPQAERVCEAPLVLAVP
jgi:hypothetical protein